MRRSAGALMAVAVLLMGVAGSAAAAPGGPTVTIDQAAGQSDPTSASPITFTVTFSEAVSDFTAADVDVSSSTAGGTLAATVEGSGTTYTVSVTGMTTSGTVVAGLPADVATGDISGLGSQASSSTDNTVT